MLMLPRMAKAGSSSALVFACRFQTESVKRCHLRQLWTPPCCIEAAAASVQRHGRCPERSLLCSAREAAVAVMLRPSLLLSAFGLEFRPVDVTTPLEAESPSVAGGGAESARPEMSAACGIVGVTITAKRGTREATKQRVRPSPLCHHPPSTE